DGRRSQIECGEVQGRGDRQSDLKLCQHVSAAAADMPEMSRRKDARFAEQVAPRVLRRAPQERRRLLDARMRRELDRVAPPVEQTAVVYQRDAGLEHGATPFESACRDFRGIAARVLSFLQALDVFAIVAAFPGPAGHRL